MRLTQALTSYMKCRSSSSGRAQRYFLGKGSNDGTHGIPRYQISRY